MVTDAVIIIVSCVINGDDWAIIVLYWRGWLLWYFDDYFLW